MLKELIFYQTERGAVPFQKWLSSLKDLKGVTKIKTRLNRLALGNYGDCKNLKNGVKELRIDYGPGYRVYFAELNRKTTILLIIGGTKRTQDKDIKKAVEYWQLFKTRFENE